MNESPQNIPGTNPLLKKGGVHPKTGTVELVNTTKRFNRDFIFFKVNYTFKTQRSYAITGPNGSGKSTLLQAIAGSLQLSEGKIIYKSSNGVDEIQPEKIHQQVSIAAPYLELIEEMTAKEFLNFHKQFKPLFEGLGVEDILTEIGLENAMDKQIRYYSSGMKQRVKLAQAVFSDVPVLLLDEPCTNLDKTGYDLYHSLIEKYCRHKLIIVSSNDANEMSFCDERINIIDHKRPA
ncbi:ABC transporter ATP-binding protein [Sediminibacterium roseum]|uniref:ABC transporter ATP-binding protein n=1 Tax=Sediminibacterium roseum TaxID=1978412 RepID=A0ABW9ZPA4_9BACT|nr:ABC transporter ATP-binding protein [Sediminibacterium roseum]